jgi:hypothetical protein
MSSEKVVLWFCIEIWLEIPVMQRYELAVTQPEDADVGDTVVYDTVDIQHAEVKTLVHV